MCGMRRRTEHRTGVGVVPSPSSRSLDLSGTLDYVLYFSHGYGLALALE
jgi:hypothetical protein